jgi:hypothetical protein
MLKHEQERLQIEEAHKQEFDNFNAECDRKLQEK